MNEKGLSFARWGTWDGENLLWRTTVASLSSSSSTASLPWHFQDFLLLRGFTDPVVFGLRSPEIVASRHFPRTILAMPICIFFYSNVTFDVNSFSSSSSIANSIEDIDGEGILIFLDLLLSIWEIRKVLSSFFLFSRNNIFCMFDREEKKKLFCLVIFSYKKIKKIAKLLFSNVSWI